jgi:hypothetical protein
VIPLEIPVALAAGTDTIAFAAGLRDVFGRL